MIPRVLVDTDVVSYLFKGDSRAQLYKQHLTNVLPLISFMSLAELMRWTIEHNWGSARRRQLETHINKFILYPFDKDLCHKWAEVTTETRHRGRPIQHSDAWIAATALLEGIPLITHNRSDFVGVSGLVVISES